MIQADYERLLFALAASAVALAVLVAGTRRKASCPVLIGGLLLGGVVAELVAPGRPLFGQQPFLAGSGLVRLWTWEMNGPARRAFEPWSWALTLALSWGAIRAHGWRRGALLAGLGAFLALRAAECVMLGGDAPGWMFVLRDRGVPTAIAIAALGAVAFGLKDMEKRGERGTFGAALLCLLGHAALIALPSVERSQTPVTVAAHYYSWFPENWVASYIGQKLVPPVKPLLGEYDSGDLRVFERHVALAKEGGIDLFIFDWWAKRPNVRRRVLQQAEWLDGHDGMKFALHYEALDLKEPKDEVVIGEDQNVVVMTQERADRLKRQWEYLAKHYMLRPSYFRERNAAVLFVYATRHLVGPVREAIEAARRHVKATTGVELFIVGDEVYFNVLRYDRGRGVYLLPKGTPDWDRLLGFDAITAYNPYDESRPEHGGSAGVSRFITDVEGLYARYRAVAATAGIRFVPTVLPGYNDRGVRPNENHFVIPRVTKDGSFFARGLSTFANCRFSGESGLVAVTSWNEWNEGTQIEPTAESPMTRVDVSGSERFSQGELLGGYGTQHLSELRALPRRCN